MSNGEKRFERLYLPGLVFLSGMSGLLYEVVWMRMLIRVFGITLFATSTIIAVYMGGLALGSWCAGRWSARRTYSLKSYGGLELGIGMAALLATLAMNRLPGLYASIASSWELPQWGRSPLWEGLIRLALSSGVLLGPTFLMGATLPLLSRWMTRRDEEVGSKLAGLYGINTAGAVAGVLSAGFFFLEVWGEMRTVYLGACLNVLVGSVVLLHPGAFRLPIGGVGQEKEQRTVFHKLGKRPLLYLSLGAVSGFCAMAYEVLWTRMLILILGSSVYAFSMVLALYLLGIALGSLVVAHWADRLRSPILSFGILQVFLMLLNTASLHLFRTFGLHTSEFNYLYSPLGSVGDLLGFFWMGALIIFPITFIFGVTFPLLGRILTRDFRQVGSALGILYAWNSVGGVLGALGVAYWLIPTLGAHASFFLLGIISLFMGSGVLAFQGMKRRELLSWVGVGLVAVFLTPGRDNVLLEIISRRVGSQWSLLFHQEDESATITGYQMGATKMLLVDGIITSGNGQPGFLMAHLPLILHQKPSKALVVCFGVGNTFRAAVEHVGRVDVVELLKGVVKHFGVFHEEAYSYLYRKGVRIFVNDGRNYMLLSRDFYDAIIVDASPPIFSAGTVNLYSREFVQLSRDRLTDSGILTLWVPIPCFEKDFWMIARNFIDVFSHVRVWSNPNMPGILIMGSRVPIEKQSSTIARNIRERHINRAAPWFTPKLVDHGWVLSEEEVRRFAMRYPAVTDDRPYTEFPLGSFLSGQRFWDHPEFILKARQSRPGL